ncbi:MAG: AAC(3) family N-acetyltransferase [Clostridia bacterium]|nr:AAC(3) family N-acetyltransferase [Clostridia bacterium]
METVVTKEDIIKAIKDLGIVEGDSVIVHSSFKSFGHVEGGAETVISAFEEVLTKKGILIFPTLVQKEFPTAYDTWYMDKPSDVGYLTEYFRKREGSHRSDQATHSVAASGE